MTEHEKHLVQKITHPHCYQCQVVIARRDFKQAVANGLFTKSREARLKKEK